MAQNTPQPAANVLYIVSSWVPEDQLEAWNRWHTEVHIPEILASSPIRAAHKYRVLTDNRPAEWQPQYVTVYELASEADWETYNTSAVTGELRADYLAHSPGGKLSRQVLLRES